MEFPFDTAAVNCRNHLSFLTQSIRKDRPDAREKIAIDHVKISSSQRLSQIFPMIDISINCRMKQGRHAVPCRSVLSKSHAGLIHCDKVAEYQSI